MSRQAKVKPKNCRPLKNPQQEWSKDIIDFTNSLLKRKRFQRLGENGITEIKQHPWLINYPWKYLKQKISKPEYIPKKNADNFDPKNVNKKDQPINPDLFSLLKNKDVQKMFDSYYYEGENKNNNEKEEVVLSTTRESNRIYY